jgi:signal recognition particle subunit SEC65
MLIWLQPLTTRRRKNYKKILPKKEAVENTVITEVTETTEVIEVTEITEEAETEITEEAETENSIKVTIIKGIIIISIKKKNSQAILPSTMKQDPNFSIAKSLNQRLIKKSKKHPKKISLISDQ